jgi:hypothetical protein
METRARAKELNTGSLCRYTATLKHLEKYFPSKPAPRQKVKPFTVKEVRAILEAFRDNRYLRKLSRISRQ